MPPVSKVTGVRHSSVEAGSQVGKVEVPNDKVFTTQEDVLVEFANLFKQVKMPVLVRTLDDISDWLKFDEKYFDYIDEKKKLTSEKKGEVFFEMSEANEGCEEVLELILNQYHECFSRNGHKVENLLTEDIWDLREKDNHPLLVAAHLVQEDLCLLKKGENDNYYLVAAAVHFPSAWRLEKKKGLSIAEIHKPVEHYKPLEKRVDKLAMGMSVERPQVRFNALIYENPRLHQPMRIPARKEIAFNDFGSKLWLRVERQTLRRLPTNQDFILFTIKPHVFPLSVLERHKGLAGKVLEDYKAYDPEEFRILIEYLEKRVL